MSNLVYIALDNFEESPISPDAWLIAANQCDTVIVIQENRHGVICAVVLLKGDMSARLVLSPEGLVQAKNPSRELIVAMFKLSGILNAGVYSERRNRYRSVEHMDRVIKRREKSRKNRRLRIALGILITILFVALALLVFDFGFFIVDMLKKLGDSLVPLKRTT